MGAATAPQEDFENHLAITLKTRRGATAPIVSCMGAAKAPKGTKKPVLTPGIMQNHAQFAPGAWVPHLKKISKTILLSPLVCLGDP